LERWLMAEWRRDETQTPPTQGRRASARSEWREEKKEGNRECGMCSHAGVGFRIGTGARTASEPRSCARRIGRGLHAHDCHARVAVHAHAPSRSQPPPDDQRLLPVRAPAHACGARRKGKGSERGRVKEREREGARREGFKGGSKGETSEKLKGRDRTRSPIFLSLVPGGRNSYCSSSGKIRWIFRWIRWIFKLDIQIKFRYSAEYDCKMQNIRKWQRLGYPGIFYPGKRQNSKT
jgi:hypothetical protein